MSVKAIGGSKFEVSPLEPFGEIWSPRDGEPVDIPPWLICDVEGIVAETRRAKLIVIEQGTNVRWAHLEDDSDTDGPHIDFADESSDQDIAVHVLHSRGRNFPTGYALPSQLSAAATKHVKAFREDVATIPPSIARSYGLDAMVEHYSGPNPAYSHPMRGPHAQLRDRWLTMESSNPDFLGVKRAYATVDRFYRRVGIETEKYPHRWHVLPGSTVLAYQHAEDPRADLEEIVHHFSLPGAAQGRRNHCGVQRNYILAEQRDSGITYRVWR